MVAGRRRTPVVLVLCRRYIVPISKVGLRPRRKLALKRSVVRLGAVVLQLPSYLCLFCFLTAAPHGVTPSTFDAGAPSSADVATPGIGQFVVTQPYRVPPVNGQLSGPQR